MSLTSETSYLHGALKPRVEILSPCAYSLGDKAISLAELAGLTLDPWQRDAIDAMLGVRDDGKWSSFEYGEMVPRQNGKGGILEARALAGLFLLDEKLIMWSSHEYKTSQEAFLRVRDLVYELERVGAIASGMVTTISGRGDEMFELRDTGQRVKFIARSKSSGRGFSGDLNIIDEAFAYTSVQQAALMPTVSARANAQLVYTSTPPLDGNTGEVLYSLRKRALSGTAVSLSWRDWGAAGTLDDIATIDIRSRKLWAQTNPALGIRITEEAIEREANSLGTLEFARERLGIWPRQKTQGGGDIDLDLWHKLIDTGSMRKGDCAIGVDIAPHRDSAALGLYARGNTGYDHLQLISYGFGVAWIIDRMIELRDRLQPIAWAMGIGTFLSLENALKAAGFRRSDEADQFKRGDLLVMSGSTMAAACGQMIDAVREGTMRVKPDADSPEVLESAVVGAHLREGNDSVSWSRKGKADITPLVAVTEARFAFMSHVDDGNDDQAFFGSWR